MGGDALAVCLAGLNIWNQVAFYETDQIIARSWNKFNVACILFARNQNSVTMKSLKTFSLITALFLGLFSSVFAGDGWLTDFEAAKTKAAAENKAMLLDFTGSDWCGWCIKLDKEVFSKQAFQDYAASNLVLVELDFPRSKEQSAEVKAQNEALAKRYNIRGFPTILILSSDGELVEKTGYQRGGAAAYVEHLKEIIEKI